MFAERVVVPPLQNKPVKSNSTICGTVKCSAKTVVGDVKYGQPLLLQMIPCRRRVLYGPKVFVIGLKSAVLCMTQRQREKVVACLKGVWFLGLWMLLVGAGDARTGEAIEDLGATVRYYPPESVGPSPMSLNLGLWGGLFFPSGKHELYDSTAHIHSPLRAPSPTLGLRLGFFPLSFAGVELESGYSFLENQRKEANNLINTWGQIVLRWPAKLAPFILFGGGFLHVSGETGEDLDGAIQWGLGATYYPKSRWGLRLDGRHIISGRRGPNAGNTSHYSLTMGLSYTLFRPAPVPMVVKPLPVPPILAQPETKAKKAETPMVEANKTIFLYSAEPAQFGFDSVKVPPKYESVLSEIAHLVVSRTDLEVWVIGHTDAVGSETYNDNLSLRRAIAVAEALEAKGVPKRLIHSKGEGERRPVATNSTLEGRKRNRRTEVTITEQNGEANDPHLSTVGDLGLPKDSAQGFLPSARREAVLEAPPEEANSD
ncbi:MAG: OmpA family protein [Myxococcales bacterium]|nr:OmpA family protein [Myxococcales bacterium]